MNTDRTVWIAVVLADRRLAIKAFDSEIAADVAVAQQADNADRVCVTELALPQGV